MAQKVINEQDSIFFKKGKNTYWLTVSGETGSMIDISNMVNVFPERHAGRQAIKDSRYHAFEIKFAIQSARDKIYAPLYRFPKYGVGLYFGTFHNPNIGYPISIFGWSEIPFSTAHRNQNFSFGYGSEFGLAWGFRPYHKETNPTNVFMGAAESYMVGFYFYGNYHINPNLRIEATFGYRHFSNGAWKQPNIGINIIPVSVSVKYQINPSYLPQEKALLSSPDCLKNWKLGIKIAAGRKQNGLDTPYFWKVLTGITLLRQISHKHSIGGGVETTLSFGKMDNGNTQRATWRNIVSPSIIGCWEWFLSPRLVMPIEGGIYLLQKNEVNG
jgi:hypothetical protein